MFEKFKLHLFICILHHVCVCVYKFHGVWVVVTGQVSEINFLLSFYHVGPKAQAQVIRLSSICLYLWVNQIAHKLLSLKFFHHYYLFIWDILDSLKKIVWNWVLSILSGFQLFM